MKLIFLKARNFRNLKDIFYETGKNLNLIIGNNAQGKTNILEAIFAVATNGSFRTATDKHMVNYQEKGFTVNARYQLEERKIECLLEYDKEKGKTLKINGKKAAKNHPDRLRVVLFTPDDLYLIKGSPGKRRNFLDFTLKQLSAEHAHQLDKYVKLLKKRNLLYKKEQANSKTFRIMEEFFIESAAKVILSRINYAALLDESAQNIYRQLNNDKVLLKIRYALSFPVDNDKINLEIIKDKLREQIKNKRGEEILRKTSLVGPHLDDINIYQDGKLARLFASQGQQRNIAITLKLSELETFFRIKGYYPVFLLDEVLSELDENKKELLLSFLARAECQSFLTSVDAIEAGLAKASTTYIKDGNPLRKE